MYRKAEIFTHIKKNNWTSGVIFLKLWNLCCCWSENVINPPRTKSYYFSDLRKLVSWFIVIGDRSNLTNSICISHKQRIEIILNHNVVFLAAYKTRDNIKHTNKNHQWKSPTVYIRNNDECYVDQRAGEQR